MNISEGVKNDIELFFDFFLETYTRLIEINNDKIQSIDSRKYIDVDVLFLYRFVRIEIDHLKNLDPTIYDVDLKHIFDSATTTVKMLVRFKKSQVASHIIFKNNFLNFNDEFKKINDRFRKARANQSRNSIEADVLSKQLMKLKKLEQDETHDFKILHSKLADISQAIDDSRKEVEIAVYDKEKFEKRYLEAFLAAHKKHYDVVISALLKQIGIFSFTMDKKLWTNMSFSQKAKRFFMQINLNEKDMNISTYMKYHLDHQTSLDNTGETQIRFRKKLLVIIDRIKTSKAS